MKLFALSSFCFLSVLSAQAGYMDTSTQVDSHPKPVFDGSDANKEHIAITLKLVGSGFTQITSIAVAPHDEMRLLVLEKAGKASWLNLKDGSKQTAFSLNVDSQGEMGLLGLAFDPDYKNTHKVYINYNPKGSVLRTRISEWVLNKSLSRERVLLEIKQPYNNHNAGALAFGKDGALYFGLGDGGSLSDPHGNAQNDKTVLGKFLRVDVHKAHPKVEIWAKGFRNPWRFSFAPDGTPIVADVGQDRFEEIDLVEKGKNYGWNIQEGPACFHPTQNCRQSGLVKPAYSYSAEPSTRAVVIGGFVARDPKIAALKGKYVFADFMMGRFWAAEFPGFKKIYALGRFPLLPVTFGQSSAGKLYVADFKSGAVYSIEP